MEPAKRPRFERYLRIDDARGYTLHETLIAMVLISLGVLGLAMNTNGVIRGNHRSDTLTVATNLAQDKMEELKARGALTNVNNCAGSGTGLEPADIKITATGVPGGIYDRCWAIQDSTLGAALKQVDVTISWQDHDLRSVTLSTLVYRR
jgi:Tfp pilus assembly protein PilV